VQEILILGTGKMARNIGLFFLRHDCVLSWISRDTSRAESFRNQLKKDLRRLALVLDKHPDDFNAHVVDISKIQQRKYDLILESIEEDLSKKQEIIRKVQPLLTSDTILASNSSSLLPNQIHDSAIGLHFFYPLELIGLVEIIINPKIIMEEIQGLVNQLKSWGIKPIIQNENNAFAVNRLLLPMQAEAFRLLQKGYPAKMINECSISDQIKIGQLELLDSIGFDVLLPAIKNYVSHLPDLEQNKYNELIIGLELLIKYGKLGKKNRNGLLMGDPLPWESNTRFSKEVSPFIENFIDIFNNTCRQFIDNNQIEKDELNVVLKVLFS
jgi:3-hydroxybutyryl-CoA dehydrogenase